MENTNDDYSHHANPVQTLASPQPTSAQQHYNRRFPAHFHPSYQSQLQHLPPPPPPPAQTRAQPSVRRHAPRTKPPGTRFSAPHLESTYTSHQKNKKTYKFQKYYNKGPKWIHRHGLINGINYHWVETTHNGDSDDDSNVIDKPLVILLHGFPQFWYTWRHQIVPLSNAGYRVVAPDLRGFNLTDKPAATKRTSASNRESSDYTTFEAARDDEEINKNQAGNYDMETLTTDVRALMMFLGYEQAHIVGHDWGGIIAWAFAARFPEHTVKLVVMNAPHLCHWRDVTTAYSSASCLEQSRWTCWYTLCCQLLPSWIPESILSYQRSWLLTHNMTSAPSYARSLSCIPSSEVIVEATMCADSNGLTNGDSIVAPGGGGCAGLWKTSDMDLYRDAISKPGAIYALLEYYRNLWQSIHQMETYGKIPEELPILVLWGLKDKTFPREMYACGWEQWASSVTVTYLDCGHFTPEEMPEEVNCELLNFFGPPIPSS